MIVVDPSTINAEFTRVDDDETIEIVKNQYGFEAIAEFLEHLK